MSGYAIVLHGEGIRALVVGGGSVAARKAAALVDAGATVRVVAPEISQEMMVIVNAGEAHWTQSVYEQDLVGDSNLVFAATDSADVNAIVALDARELGLMVNMASDAEDGDFSTPATHRDGPVLVAVYAGGVPAAAMQIRDAVARLVGSRVSVAVQRLARLRSARLTSGDAASWREASRELVGEDFLDSIANGEFDRRFERWG